MTTAELGLITTMAVGISAAAAPALTAWANRAHERTMLRSQRAYDQRRQTYIDLSIFLERQRQLLSDVGSGSATIETLEELKDRSELDNLLGRLAVDGTAEVQKGLEGYAGARNATLGFLIMLLEFGDDDDPPPAASDAWKMLLGSTPVTLGAAEAVQRAMRDELAGI